MPLDFERIDAVEQKVEQKHEKKLAIAREKRQKHLAVVKARLESKSEKIMGALNDYMVELIKVKGKAYSYHFEFRFLKDNCDGTRRMKSAHKNLHDVLFFSGAPFNRRGKSYVSDECLLVCDVINKSLGGAGNVRYTSPEYKEDVYGIVVISHGGYFTWVIER